MAPILSASSECGGGGSGDAFACSDLAACSIDDLEDVSTLGAAEGDVLTLEGSTWVAAAPAGGGIVDFAEAVVDPGNGATPATTFGDVTGLADITVDASEGDLVGVAWNGLTLGGQTFYRFSTIVSAAVAVSHAVVGWYKTSNLASEGLATSAEYKFLVTAPDLDGATLTIRLEGRTVGGAGVVLEGSQLQVTNYGPVGA